METLQLLARNTVRWYGVHDHANLDSHIGLDTLQKVNAIKYLRGVSGVGLKEAKDAIEDAILDIREKLDYTQFENRELQVGATMIENGKIDDGLAHIMGVSAAHRARVASLWNWPYQPVND